MAGTLRVLGLVLLIVLAGCGGAVQETEPTATTDTTTTTVESTTTLPDNPWRAETVTVAIENNANASRNLAPLVNQTLEYWNDRANYYGDYSVRFVSQPHATAEADIVVSFVDRIGDCGFELDVENLTGCATILETGTVAASQETVEIKAGYVNESTVSTMKHEFGHILGIDHGEEPMPVMAETSDTTLWPKPNATARPDAWKNETVSLYVAYSDISQNYKRVTVRSELQHVVEYVNSGADGSLAANSTLVMTESRADADIVVTFPESVECGGENASTVSCGRLTGGVQLDSDSRWEYYSGAEIGVSRIHTETVSWHVGVWLLYSFGLTEGELPAVFRNAGYNRRAGQWWE